MKPQMRQEINKLFSDFHQEEQSSSFAVENLLNRTIQIINKYERGEAQPQNPSEGGKS